MNFNKTHTVAYKSLCQIVLWLSVRKKKIKLFSRYKRGNISFKLSRGFKIVPVDVNVNAGNKTTAELI